MDNIWSGDGIWSGWSLTTDHATSSYGQPVLVSPDKRAYGPADIANPLSQVTTVKGYALMTGLHIRKVQRMCEKGELTAKNVHGVWLILLPSE